MKVKALLEFGMIKCMSQMCTKDCPNFDKCKLYEISIKEIK